MHIKSLKRKHKSKCNKRWDNRNINIIKNYSGPWNERPDICDRVESREVANNLETAADSTAIDNIIRIN